MLRQPGQRCNALERVFWRSWAARSGIDVIAGALLDLLAGKLVLGSTDFDSDPEFEIETDVSFALVASLPSLEEYTPASSSFCLRHARASAVTSTPPGCGLAGGVSSLPY